MLRIIIEQSNWVTVRRHCNTFWHFIINFQVFGKSFLDALLKQNKIKIAVILCKKINKYQFSTLKELTFFEILPEIELFIKKNMASNNQQTGAAAAEREQKMLESSMENLLQRLTSLKGSLNSHIAKVETDPTLNWPKFLDSFAEIGGQMNSLLKNIKSETSKNPPLQYKKYITLPLFLSPDRDEELVKMTEGRVATFR